MNKTIKKLIALSSVALFTSSFPYNKSSYTAYAGELSQNEDINKDDEGVLKVNLNEDGTADYSINGVSGTAVSEDDLENQLFSWDNATVYFLLTDRFENGDPSNDHSYGRSLDANGNVINGYKDAPGTFHGGDLKGITKKINDGYFTDLGINAIWFTAPYEQIHGYTSANLKATDDNKAGEDGSGFSYYGYHGYWALDFTSLDKNMGTRDDSVSDVSKVSTSEDDMKEFVTAAHKKGIRVIMDVVMNHVGYATLKDMDEFGFGATKGDWKSYYYGPEANRKGGAWEQESLYDLNSDKWGNWWGKDWIRFEKQMYNYTVGGSDEKTCCSGGLPDVISESQSEVEIPVFLQEKWKKEGRYDQEVEELDAFFKQSGLKKTPINYIVKWLSDWVKDYGIDGFRCDTAKHIEVEHWGTLKTEADKALKEWRKNNQGEPGAQWTDDFWMTGECYGLGVNLGVDYYDNGFDSMINFSFPKDGATGNTLEAQYKIYSTINASGGTRNILSYISSHDDCMGGRKDLYKAGASLLLAPGGVQIYYGDETGRQEHAEPWGWKDLRYRIDMNWDSMDKNVLSFWSKLSNFRKNHLAVGGGVHTKISNDSDGFYAFKREYNKNGNKDTVVCVTQAKGGQTITLDVSAAFSEGVKLRDAYSGEVTEVSDDGTVTFKASDTGILLLEKANFKPIIVNNNNSGNSGNQKDDDKKDDNQKDDDTSKDDDNEETLKCGSIKVSKEEATVGDKIKITVSSATGGDSDYSYKFLVDGKVIQDFSSKTTATWTPEEEGECTIKVIVQDGNGKTATSSLDYIVNSVNDSDNDSDKPNDDKNQDTDDDNQGKDDNQDTDDDSNKDDEELQFDNLQYNESNTEVYEKRTFKASALGGDGDYMYKFTIKKGSKVVYDGKYQSKNTLSWIPDTEGSYSITVSIKDGSGSSVNSDKYKFTVVNSIKDNDDQKDDNQGDTFDENNILAAILLLTMTGSLLGYSYKRKKHNNN
ncbi:alpha-amylase family glycosyl hydrolase [Clostridium sp. HCP1S3_B4]|uniref:alpha-amylase family glycosyl hydrolase n=1 Tax=unclassified Clostridium TaxID=2614128 RepID=UPI003F8AA0A3